MSAYSFFLLSHRRARAALCAVAVAGAVSATSSSARAQDDFQKKEAQQRFQEGVALMHDGKHEQARVKFVQAYAMTGTNKVPNVTFNLARAEHLTNHPLEAVRHYREYLKTADPKKISAKDKSDIDGWLTDLSKVLARLDITAPAGAHLSVDGERVGDAPLPDVVDVTRGKHAVVAEVKGKRIDAEADASAGGVVKVVLNEETAPPAAALPTALPTTSAAGAEDRAPVTSPPPEVRESWGTGQWLGVGIAGAGLLSVGAGVAFASAKGNSSDDVSMLQSQSGGCSVDPSLRQCSQLQDKRDEESMNGTLSTAFLIGGVAALVGGVVLFFALPKAKTTSAPITSGKSATSNGAWLPAFNGRVSGMQFRF